MRPPLLFLALSAVLLGACYSAGDGQAPPLASLYFPTGLALDVLRPTAETDASGNPTPPAPPNHLFVASSDFDLQYRASALASYDLVALAAVLPHSCNVDADCAQYGRTCDATSADPSYFCIGAGAGEGPCRSLGEHSPADQVLYPGRCKSIDTRDARNGKLIASQVEIGAFATDILFKQPGDTAPPHPSYTGRLFLPVRGDATLHWIDVDDSGALDCGQANTSDDSCDAAHRVGDDQYTESPNMLRQEPEPFGIAIDDAGENIAVTNQTTGSISLYVNQWTTLSQQPKLVYVLGGLPSAPVGIAALPSPESLATGYEPGFLTVYRNAPQVDLLRVHADPSAELVQGESYAPRVLTRSATVGINANSTGFDSRGIVIDDSQRKADYVACDARCKNPTGDALAACTACYQAVHQPSVFVSNRAPASILVGALDQDFGYPWGTNELPAFTDSLPLTVGPSRIVLGKVRVPSAAADATKDTAGNYVLEPRVFIVCFDSRRVYIYDPQRHVIDSIVDTGRGPFALAIDEQRGLGYLAHFTDSYLGVISLDQRFPKNYAAIVASVGVPSPPRASK